MKRYQWQVASETAGQRLDLAMVSSEMSSELGLSRRKVRALIDVGGVYVNNKRIRIASRVVSEGDVIRVEYLPSQLSNQLSGKRGFDFQFTVSDILFDEDDVIAVNKPPGLPSQATRDQAVEHVIACLKKFLTDRGEQTSRRSLQLTHRLDRETSGIIVVATSKARGQELFEAFRQRRVQKRYLAICYGLPTNKRFSVENRLSEIQPHVGMVKAVTTGGKAAVTEFTVQQVNTELGLCLVEARPVTGRSHQIRVHLADSGLPIVGDKRYGSPSSLPDPLAEWASAHHFLHARQITLPLQGRPRPVVIQAKLPMRMARFAEAVFKFGPAEIATGNI